MDDNRTAPFANKQRIRALWLNRRMRAEEVAQKAGISTAQIYRLEAGERPNVAAVTLARVALALGTSVEYLLSLSNDARSIHQLIAQITTLSVDEYEDRENA